MLDVGISIIDCHMQLALSQNHISRIRISPLIPVWTYTGSSPSTSAFHWPGYPLAHHLRVQERRHNCREQRLLHVAWGSDQNGGPSLRDRGCPRGDSLVARGRFRVLCGACHRHGTRYERIGGEIPVLFCPGNTAIERAHKVIVTTTQMNICTQIVFIPMMIIMTMITTPTSHHVHRRMILP